jgi:CHAT domain-containing protein/Tfp pilus assembly protein PilF
LRGLVRIGTALLVAGPLAAQADPETEALALGRPLTLTLPADALAPEAIGELATARYLRYVPELDGPLTLRVESAAADPLAALLDENGRPRALDDDGLIGWDARLVVEGRAGAPLDFAVGFKQRVAGTLVATLTAGNLPPLEGAERMSEEAAFLRRRGMALLERGETLPAAVDLHEAGQREVNLGRVAQSRQDYTLVLELAEQAGHPTLKTLALARIGAAEAQFGELGAAAEHLEAAARGARELPHPALEMLALSSLATVHLDQGQAALARADLERALTLVQETGDVANEVGLCGQMGDVAWLLDQRDEAAEWHERALSRARELDSPEALAGALLAAGRFREQAGEFGEARALLEQALELPRDAQHSAAVRGQLANVFVRTGEELAARDLYEQVLASARVLGDAGLESSALLSLGGVAYRLGDLDDARRRLEEGLALLGSDGSPARRCEGLHTLALAHMDSDALETARPLLDESLALAREIEDRPREMLGLSGLVAWHYHRGEYDRALPLARQQLELTSELERDDLRAPAASMLAELTLRLGDVAGARTRIDEALDLLRALDDPRLLQWGLLTAVEVSADEGDTVAMAANVREAEALFERADPGRLDPEEASLLRAQDVYALWGGWSQELVTLQLAAEPSPAQARAVLEQGFRRAGLWKGRALLQGIAEHRQGARSAETIALRRARRETLAEREALLARCSALQREARPDAARLTALRTEAEEHAREAASLLAQMQAAAPGEAALEAPQGIGPEAVVPLLEPGEVLIEYVEARRNLGAYVLAGGQLDYRLLGPLDEIEADTRAFLDGIARPDALAPVSEVAQRGATLHAQLLAPLLPAVADDARLVIVPTAALAALPFEALVSAAPEAPKGFHELVFVIDRHEVTYLPSTPVLALLAQTGARTAPGPALVLADPIYASEAGARSSPRAGDLASADWPRLPGTRDEALSIVGALLGEQHGEQESALLADLARRFGEERSLSIETPTFSLHLGAAATPARLGEDARRFSILHCASHGLVDPGDPRKSGLVLAADESSDGLLRAAQILELDLDAELAVLSACETATGAIRRGEGVQSLARAFLYAGARSVVASLWPVDDFETQQIMSAFYADVIAEGSSPAVALRRARLSVRELRPGGRGRLVTGRGRPLAASPPAGPSASRAGHPYYWAPFVYVGLPRARVAVPVRSR